MKKADFILTGDWHLRDTLPICRTDDFMSAMWRKVDFIISLQKRHKCPILHSGDLFDTWKPSLYLLAQTIEHLKGSDFWTIYGNHDLPQHNIELKEKSGIYCLEKAAVVTVPPGKHWDTNFEVTWRGLISEDIERTICVAHVMTYQGKKPWHDCTDPMAVKLLRQNKEYDLILTGHNHKTFVEEYKGRLLVNPGSILRSNSDQIDHKPCIFLYYAETNEVEQVFLPIESNVISKEHIEQVEQRDERINAFISSLSTEWSVEATFEQNLEKFRQTNDISQEIMNIVINAINNEL